MNEKILNNITDDKEMLDFDTEDDTGRAIDCGASDGFYLVECDDEELELDLNEDESVESKPATSRSDKESIAIGLFTPVEGAESIVRAQYNRVSDEIEILCSLYTRKSGGRFALFNKGFPAIISRNGDVRLGTDEVPDSVTCEDVCRQIREQIDLQIYGEQGELIPSSRFDYFMYKIKEHGDEAQDKY